MRPPSSSANPWQASLPVPPTYVTNCAAPLESNFTKKASSAPLVPTVLEPGIKLEDSVAPHAKVFPFSSRVTANT